MFINYLPFQTEPLAYRSSQVCFYPVPQVQPISVPVNTFQSNAQFVPANSAMMMNSGGKFIRCEVTRSH